MPRDLTNANISDVVAFTRYFSKTGDPKDIAIMRVSQDHLRQVTGVENTYVVINLAEDKSDLPLPTRDNPIPNYLGTKLLYLPGGKEGGWGFGSTMSYILGTGVNMGWKVLNISNETRISRKLLMLMRSFLNEDRVACVGVKTPWHQAKEGWNDLNGASMPHNAVSLLDPSKVSGFYPASNLYGVEEITMIYEAWFRGYYTVLLDIDYEEWDFEWLHGDTTSVNSASREMSVSEKVHSKIERANRLKRHLGMNSHEVKVLCVKV